jgi:hypothetical protein
MPYCGGPLYKQSNDDGDEKIHEAPLEGGVVFSLIPCFL